MIDAKKIYPTDNPNFFWVSCNYSPLLEAIGTIVVRVDDGYYQGDTRVLFRDGDRWGLLLLGWGSCSGCDALQACSSYEELQELCERVEDQVQWGTCEETIARLRSKDWEAEATFRSKETTEFVTKSLFELEGTTT